MKLVVRLDKNKDGSAPVEHTVEIKRLTPSTIRNKILKLQEQTNFMELKYGEKCIDSGVYVLYRNFNSCAIDVDDRILEEVYLTSKKKDNTPPVILAVDGKTKTRGPRVHVSIIPNENVIFFSQSKTPNEFIVDIKDGKLLTTNNLFNAKGFKTKKSMMAYILKNKDIFARDMLGNEKWLMNSFYDCEDVQVSLSQLNKSTYSLFTFDMDDNLVKDSLIFNREAMDRLYSMELYTKGLMSLIDGVSDTVKEKFPRMEYMINEMESCGNRVYGLLENDCGNYLLYVSSTPEQWIDERFYRDAVKFNEPSIWAYNMDKQEYEKVIWM